MPESQPLDRAGRPRRGSTAGAGRGGAGGVLLGVFAGVLSHVVCVAAFWAALLVSTALVYPDGDEAGDRAEARAAITVLVIGLAVLALAEALLLTAAVACTGGVWAGTSGSACSPGGSPVCCSW